MGPSKSKYFLGNRNGTPLVVFSASNDGLTQSRDLASAIETETAGVIFRVKTGTRNGSGVLDVDVYDSENGQDFAKVASFTQITAAGQYSKAPGVRVRRFVKLDLILTSGTGFDDTRAWVEYVEGRESGSPSGSIRES